MTVFGVLQRLFVEGMARNQSYAQLSARLEKSGDEITRRLAGAINNSMHIHQARHIIGIERWGQRRLRTALGEPLVVDEYDPYRPDDLRDIQLLSDAFAATRRETLTIIQQLEKAGVAPESTALHNEMGEISLRAWLYYLDNHAYRETRLVRTQKTAQAGS